VSTQPRLARSIDTNTGLLTEKVTSDPALTEWSLNGHCPDTDHDRSAQLDNDAAVLVPLVTRTRRGSGYLDLGLPSIEVAVQIGTVLQYGTCMEAKMAALRRGMLEPAVLAIVEHEQRYAAEIAQLLRASGFPIQDGTLHPLINRLRREGLVTHEWRESPAGPPRKYLTLSAAGREQLGEFRTYLHALATTLDSIGR